MWPNRRLLDLLGTELPIIQAPMAGANGAAMAIAVSEAGGLGSLPCAMLDADKVRAEIGVIRQQTTKPLNTNFFCHTPEEPDPDAEIQWRKALERFYLELGLNLSAAAPAPNRRPFDDEMCTIVEEVVPEIVSFHFGLPAKELVRRVKSAGCTVIASATSVAEASWLQDNGCDAVIAQGYEAGGHRGMFLAEDITTQAGTMALVPQVVDAVSVPVIASGGIADARGIAAAFALGAAGVQLGTAYLLTPEATISELHKDALRSAKDDQTMLTNIFSGRPARGLVNRIMREAGPMSDAAPIFPTAGGALAPLKAKAEENGRTDFSSLWSGQAAALASEMGSGELTRQLAEDGLKLLARLGGRAAQSIL